jgi:late competence protein required for DNA uptake (superfamily II DNA/RNA helicase)
MPEETAIMHIKKIIKTFRKTHAIRVINRNSNTDIRKEATQKHEIYIGSDLLQRGVTIKNLVVSYISRRAKGTSNADTILQMARFFGYRSEIKEFMSIYLLDQLYSDYI